MFNMLGKSLLDIHSLTKQEAVFLLDLARDLKRAKYMGTEKPLLTGKTVALLFAKDSTRTRCAFEVAAFDQGAHVTYIGPSGSHLGKKESAKDTARVLGRMYDGIEYRGFDHKIVEDLAEHAGVPVWNGLTDSWHPTQMFADVLTMQEHSFKALEDISFAYFGDTQNNMACSLLIMGALLGMDVRLCGPKELFPAQDVQKMAEKLAVESGARIMITDEPDKAADNVDFIHTDVWVSMGDPDDAWVSRSKILKPYQVNAALMKKASKRAKFMHCLPSFHNGETEKGEVLGAKFGLENICEVTDEVFESSASIVFDQAENRLHTIKAIMVASIGS